MWYIVGRGAYTVAPPGEAWRQDDDHSAHCWTLRWRSAGIESEGIERLSPEGRGKERARVCGDAPDWRFDQLCQARIQMREVLDNVSIHGLSRTNSEEMEGICKGMRGLIPVAEIAGVFSMDRRTFCMGSWKVLPVK